MLVQTTLSGEVIKKKSRVKCEICGKEFEKITGFHLKKHNMTMHEYRKQFPDASLFSEDLRKKCSDARLGKPSSMKGKHHTEEAKQKLREDHLGMKASEETKQKMRGPRPNFSGKNHPMYGKHHTEGSKQKISENHPDNLGKNNPMYGRTGEKNPSYGRTGEKNPMFGKKGELCPRWKGGISFFPYCEKFDNDLKERVRDFFGRCCYVCGKSEQEQIEEMVNNGKIPFRKLDVHHVNYDKMVCCNDVKPLFVPLCHSCHGKTQKDREGWEEFFTISLEYLTDGKCFLPKKVDSLFMEKKKNEKL